MRMLETAYSINYLIKNKDDKRNQETNRRTRTEL